jgi:hypothetical protein
VQLALELAEGDRHRCRAGLVGRVRLENKAAVEDAPFGMARKSVRTTALQ